MFKIPLTFSQDFIDAHLPHLGKRGGILQLSLPSPSLVDTPSFYGSFFP